MSGNIEGRDLYFSGNSYSLYDASLPLAQYYGKDNSGHLESDYSVYNSGEIKIEQEGATLHVTINNYDFNEIFPMYNSSWRGNSNRDKVYTDNKGTFSVGYIQIFAPDKEESIVENMNYYLTVSNSNFKVETNTQEIITTQMNTNDDDIRIQHVIYKQGMYDHQIFFQEKYTSDYLESFQGRGDAKINLGNTLRVMAKNHIGMTNDYDIYGINKFVKFDGEGYEPVYYDDGSKYKTSGFKGEVEFKVWYVTKKDGTNWTSQEKMNNGNIEDMDIYETIKDIPEDKICIGIYFELTDGYAARSVAWNNDIYFLLKIKDTAQIGQTYGITERTWYWKDPLDRSIYTIENKNIQYIEDWPEPEWDSGNKNYIKTEYDESGQVVAGTHSGGAIWGNTVLVVGANLYGTIKAIDSNNLDKVNYDLGKNEDIVTYKLEPQLDANENLASQIEDITLKAQVILPKGLSYQLGSSKRGGEAYPEPDVIENEDGTTTLEWYIYGVTSGQEIEPIEFGARISRSSDHGIQYTTTFIISEHIEDGEITKIGNSEISNRTSTETINIINLASFRLYKEAITPIIEKEGEIQYKITGINTTDVRLPDFVLLDIMPYNGDSRGTNFEGTYTIDRIEITQNIEGETRDNSNLKLYYTQDEEVKTATAKDENIGTSGIWTEVTESNNETTGNSSGLEGNETGETNAINTKCYKLNVEQSNNGVTGIAIKGELAGQTEITVDIYLKTNGNQVEDKYVNSATAQTQTITEVVQTSQESAQVIGRTISGKVWLDENYNNIIDNNEALGDLNREEIWISLYKENQEGNLEEVTNVDGQVVEAINPNEDGYYEFSHLPAANYVVKIEYNGEEYKLVEKEVGSNVEINSKFEIETNANPEGNEGGTDSNTEENAGEGEANTEIGKTELITKLNDNSNFMIIEENVNAGLLKKINLEFTKVAEENHENTIGGTEFKLYKLVCTEHDEGYHDNEQIDTSNENSCWELVDTQTSSTGGILNNEESRKVKFKDLQLDEEYRLVETKATLNRIKPDGQWKIEFTKLENVNNENNDIIINGNIKVQITAIGNPPGFIKENGELLLPNRAYFEFPTSGSIGSKTIYQIGIAIITAGMIILLTRKFVIIKNNKI